MRYPLRGKIVVTNPFGKAGGTKWYPFHTGVDLRAAKGTIVYAPESGVTKRVWSLAGGYGMKLYTKTGVHYFWHLSERQRDGKAIVGRRIANSGNSGVWTTAAHLHWELRIKGIPKDPLKYV